MANVPIDSLTELSATSFDSTNSYVIVEQNGQTYKMLASNLSVIEQQTATTMSWQNSSITTLRRYGPHSGAKHFTLDLHALWGVPIGAKAVKFEISGGESYVYIRRNDQIGLETSAIKSGSGRNARWTNQYTNWTAMHHGWDNDNGKARNHFYFSLIKDGGGDFVFSNSLSSTASTIVYNPYDNQDYSSATTVEIRVENAPGDDKTCQADIKVLQYFA